MHILAEMACPSMMDANNFCNLGSHIFTSIILCTEEKVQKNAQVFRRQQVKPIPVSEK